ncbi:hypothetical protein C7974DRAFT_307777 [Boeremia exigua]|uniref:uncharacterized protein n=1 Tax=Boeremia exigua TaxID=749465 RepID=UPI001E8EA548|nr:uncharacterized protein C7974DRAFT_307777 [Boeremia exigua]KAH6637765.1 hypothetical protein C7974DRAFT_307777 [Boeremia exigua]
MSIFLATVPEGTQLYHGTSDPDFVKGMQWLAFEPEHALIFARPRGGPGRPPPGKGEGPPDDRDSGSEGMTRSPQKRHSQQPLQEPMPAPQDPPMGHLHTYAPVHDLRLLYIDGLSAGKTSNGTLDTQDLLLLNLTSSNPDGPMGGEMARAQGLCSLASTTWGGRIDGVLRLEGGFEIILCDFEAHLQRVDVVSVASRRAPMLGGWEYVKAITSRYHGIGGARVHVDTADFVSVFEYAPAGLWDNDVRSDVKMPRLTHVAPEVLRAARDDVAALVLRKDWEAREGRDWQGVADMVVARYSGPLHYIATNRVFREDGAALAVYLGELLRPFVDVSARNAARETERCVAQFVPALPALSIPPSSLTPLGHRATHAVATRICDALLTSWSIASSPLPHSGFSTVYAEHAVEVVQELVEWLGWTSWKDCGTCGEEEVCFIPIWPMGNLEDHAKPKCRGEKDAEGRTGYWGRMGPPPGKGRAPGERDVKR